MSQGESYALTMSSAPPSALLYTTVTFNTPCGPDDIDMIRSCVLATDMDLAKIDIIGNPDDGNKVRMSVRHPEYEAIQHMQELRYYADEIFTDDDAETRMVATQHVEQFDDADLWPEEHIEHYLIENGYETLRLTFMVPEWFPDSLVHSICFDLSHGLIATYGMDEDQILGVGIDQSMPGVPTVTIWSDSAAHAVLAPDMHRLVEESIDTVSGQRLLTSWFSRLQF